MKDWAESTKRRQLWIIRERDNKNEIIRHSSDYANELVLYSS